MGQGSGQHIQSIPADNQDLDLCHFAESRRTQRATLAGREKEKSNDGSLPITSVRGDHLIPPKAHFYNT